MFLSKLWWSDPTSSGSQKLPDNLHAKVDDIVDTVRQKDIYSHLTICEDGEKSLLLGEVGYVD